MTDPSELEALKHNPQIVRLIGQRVKLVKTGREFTGLCPFHQENHGSFKLYQKDGIWLATCHGGCGTFNLLQVVHKMDGGSFTDAIKRVNEFLGTAPNRVDEVFKPVVDDSTPKTTFTLDQFQKLESAFDESREAIDWLRNRGISYETAKKLHTGFRKDCSKLSQHKSPAGWLAFPRIRENQVVGIKYRSLEGKGFCQQPGMESSALYPDTSVVDPLEPVYLVEGEPDALSMTEIGLHCLSLPNATSHLTPEQKDLLMQAEYIVLAGDTDAAGEACMAKLATTLGEKCYLLRWPSGKDANEFLLGECKRDIRVFETRIKELTSLARSQPMRGVTTLQSALMDHNGERPSENPLRLRFPWKSVDTMVNLLPGSVLALFATSTGMGKTTFVMNMLVEAALRGEVILNYSAELSPSEYAQIVVAHTVRKNRNGLSKDDYKKTCNLLKDSRIYIGNDPDLSTVNQVLDLVEAAVKRLSCSILVIDHLHYIVRNESDTVKAQENAMQRIRNLSIKYGLKTIVVGQPRKASSQNRGKVVQISDGKGSESFASDSNATIALHRAIARMDDPNNPPKEPYAPLTEVHMLKGRSQGTGNAFAQLMFLGELATYVEVSNHPDPTGENMFGNNA